MEKNAKIKRTEENQKNYLENRKNTSKKNVKIERTNKEEKEEQQTTLKSGEINLRSYLKQNKKQRFSFKGVVLALT